MGHGYVPVAGDALAALVVALDAPGTTVAGALAAVGSDVRPTRALSLSSALATLTACEFDLLLVEVGSTDPALVDGVRRLKERAGAAAVVVVHDEPVPAVHLAEVADVVLAHHELAGPWLRPIRAMAENARLKAALAEAESSAARLLGIVDSVGDAVFSVEVDGTVSSWNRGAEALYGWRADEIVGRDFALLHPPGSDEPSRLLAMAHRGEGVRGHDTVRRTRDGQLAEVSVDVTGQRGPDGALLGVVVVARDITDRRELEAELVRQTMHDALTGLPNRAYLTYRLAQSLAEARRREDPVAVLVVDLDQFRAVDDLHGHLVGDRVLVEVAERLRRLVRPIDIVARAGGDEFVVVCPGTDVPAAEKLAQRVIAAIAEPIEVGQRAVRIGSSIGIAVSPPLEGGATTMLKHADIAMYEAKSRGRARSQVFDHTFARQAGEQRKLAAELRDAVDRDRLEVHYQPVHDLVTDRIVGVEALARWTHPLGGAVPPGTFVPLAESHGFIGDLDRWVLSRSCHDIAGAIATGQLPPETRVAVNLSARSLDDPDLVVTVDEVLQHSGLPVSSLILEVTETAVLANRDAARASIEGLRSIGVDVHLDDFGTGYSSLSFLRELPVSGVKIDRSFVRDATGRPEDMAITEAVVRLARGLGLDTVAEGIETSEQRDLLRSLGCEHAQGFWWSAALPLAQLTDGVGGAPGARAVTGVGEPASPVTRRRWALSRRTVPQPRAVSRTACCLRGSLDSGQAWLVMGGAERRDALARALGATHTHATARGLLVELDAFDVLRAVTGIDGRLDPVRFEQVVGTVLRRLGSAATQVGVHAQLPEAGQPLGSLRPWSELHRRLESVTDLALAYGDDPAECPRHAAPPARSIPRLAAGGSGVVAG